MEEEFKTVNKLPEPITSMVTLGDYIYAASGQSIWCCLKGDEAFYPMEFMVVDTSEE